jgi:hypothetical protein
MTHQRLRLRALGRLVTLATSLAGIGCGDTGPTDAPSLAGTYAASVFRVTPSGQSQIDVLAQGGSLVLTIATDNSTTTGSLALPASIAGTPFTASMAGTAIRTGSTVRFQQTADTFVRDLTFTVTANSFQATNQTAGSAAFTITLLRQ